MFKKILAAVAIFGALFVVWFFTQGGGMQVVQDRLHPADTAPAVAPVAAVPTTTPAPAAPPGFQQVADALESIKLNGVVRVSNENPSEPFYGVTNGIPHGFNVEFAQLLFNDSSFHTAAHPTIALDFNHSVDTYAGVPQQLLAKGSGGFPTVDIAMDGLTFADNTPAGVVYTIPYIDDFGYALIVQHGSAIRSTNDLAGKRVGILKGDPDVKAFVTRQYPGATFVEVDDSDSSGNADEQFISKALDSHTVDAFIYDYPFAVDSIKGTDAQFAITKLEGSNLQYKIGVRAEDKDLLIYLNAAIAKLRQSPEYHALLLKYFVSNQAVTTAATAGEHVYAVRQGDTLNLIAASQLGNGQRYTEIQRRNNLANPNLILVGQHLVIPVR
jgi:LysM repeat protein